MTTTAATASELSPQPTITTAADTVTLSDGASPTDCGARVAMACSADLAVAITTCPVVLPLRHLGGFSANRRPNEK